MIAILAGMLLPALNRARTTARVASCTSNMRQIGIGMEFYTNDYNEWHIPYRSDFNPAADWAISDWHVSIGQYMPGTTVVNEGNKYYTITKCPVTQEGAANLHAQNKYGNYSYNLRLSYGPWKSAALKRSQIKRNCIAVIDGRMRTMINWFNDCQNEAAMTAHYGFANTSQTLRGGAQTNALFTDGHVEAISSRSILGNSTDTVAMDDRWYPTAEKVD